MAASAGLPVPFPYDEESSILLSDSEEDEIHIPSRHDRQQEADAMHKKAQEAAANVPLHPIPAMQPAFAESLLEATNTSAVPKPKLRFGDAKERRARLLEASKDGKLHGELWRYRPGQKYHELWKLMAQISFGVYLLLNGIANSNEQVVTILQEHIDELDEFLETTMEDIKLAIQDVSERTDLLKLPMKNMATFEKMLEDRNFRLQIVTGNEKIEHIISRTRTALDTALEDIDEGTRATKEFAVYLEDQRGRPWRQQRPDVFEIFDAMKGNAEGWWKAFDQLKENATSLDSLLIVLGQMVVEIDQRAGEVSRRTRFSVAPYSDPFSDPSDPRRSKDHSTRSVPPLSRRSSSGVRPTRSNTQSTQQSSNSARESLPVFLALGPDGPESDTEDEYQLSPRPKLGLITEAGHEEDEPSHDEGLFILQPRTYTPKPPEPLPSPMVHNLPESQLDSDLESEPEVEDEEGFEEEEREEVLPRSTSLRQRVSLKGGNPPGRIQVPPRLGPELQRPSFIRAPNSLHGHEVTYSSNLEVRSAHAVPAPYTDLTPPAIPNTLPSPLSDQQYFRPVQASPHSPLQQRPWTSGTATAAPPPRPHTSHTRNPPSRMGGASMLSNVSAANQEDKKVKKKRSAFGWLKKAFTLDDEERAQFEARKQQQMHNPYYESRSPKYLDGKRIDDYRRH